MKSLGVKEKFSMLENLERSKYSELYKIKEQRLEGRTVKTLCSRIPWIQIMCHVGYFWIHGYLKGSLKVASSWWNETQAVFAHLLHRAKGRPACCQLPWHTRQKVTFQMRCQSPQVTCGGVVFVVHFCKERKTADFGTGSVRSGLTKWCQVTSQTSLRTEKKHFEKGLWV